MNDYIRFITTGGIDYAHDEIVSIKPTLREAMDTRSHFDRYAIEVWDIKTCERIGFVRKDVPAYLLDMESFSVEDLVKLTEGLFTVAA